ncbi:MAG: Flp pilus assembly protein CpaB [bacterium]|nr:Flp pilus assembly protein CpaB [bacterium]
MRERRLLVLAILVALATGFIVYNYLAGLDQRVSVVVATTNLGEFTLLESSMLRVASLPAGGVHPRAVSSPSMLEGRVLLAPVDAGQQILITQVRDRGAVGTGNSFVAALEPGERAMLIPSTLARSVGGALAPRDRVDIIFVADQLKLGVSFARVLLQGLRVLDVRSDRGRSLGADRDGLPAGVVVAVTLEQAERLAFALENGQLYIASSGGRDEPEVPTPGAFYESLFSAESWRPDASDSE